MFYILIVLLIISISFNIILGTLIYKSLYKIDLYEQWILSTRESINNTLQIMKSIDKNGVFSTSVNDKGIFESDDEVGVIFKQLEVLLEDLDKKIQ